MKTSTFKNILNLHILHLSHNLHSYALVVKNNVRLPNYQEQLPIINHICLTIS